MAVYAIGDIQGCYDPLQRLLEALDFDPTRDTLWLVGDLVNRGPQSVQVLRLLLELGSSVVCVLGNHDLTLLAVAEGFVQPRPKDTFESVLGGPRTGNPYWTGCATNLCCTMTPNWAIPWSMLVCRRRGIWPRLRPAPPSWNRPLRGSDYLWFSGAYVRQRAGSVAG